MLIDFKCFEISLTAPAGCSWLIAPTAVRCAAAPSRSAPPPCPGPPSVPHNRPPAALPLFRFVRAGGRRTPAVVVLVFAVQSPAALEPDPPGRHSTARRRNPSPAPAPPLPPISSGA